MTKIKVMYLHRHSKKQRKKWVLPKKCMVCNSIFKVKNDATIIYCLRLPAYQEGRPNHLDTCSLLCMNMATLMLLGDK